jgi:hypothetical protein
VSDERMINECTAVDEMRNGRGNTSKGKKK